MGGLCDLDNFSFFSGINLCERVPSINKGEQLDINIDHLPTKDYINIDHLPTNF